MLYGGRFMFQSLFPVDSEARRQARDATSRVEELEDRLDRLALLSMALWSIVSERLEISDEDLQKRVQELDLSDGKLDGRITTKVGECPKCHKQLSRRNRSCIYCGYKLAPAFTG